MSTLHYEAGDTLRTQNGTDLKIESIEGRAVNLSNGQSLHHDGVGQMLHYGELDLIPAGTGDRDVYIRFGDLPDGGQSTDHSSGSKEAGISVYEAVEDDEQEDTYHPAGQQVLAVLLMLNRDVYLLSGERVGTGADGEPLIRDVETEAELEMCGETGGFKAAEGN